MPNPLTERPLSTFLTEVSNWKWDEFVRAETDEEHFSIAEGIVFSLIRACAMEKMDAIRLSINRLDGKLATPIRVEYPRVTFVFPNAQSVAAPPLIEAKESNPKLLPTNDIHISEEEAEDEQALLPTWGLRQTLAKMTTYPRSLPKQLIDRSIQTHQWVEGKADEPPDIPLVKSVVAAHLINMAQKRNLEALYEVFDAIDGKLTEVIQVVGEDIELISYATVAPYGAVKNKDGVYQTEASQTQQIWKEKLGGTNER